MLSYLISVVFDRKAKDALGFVTCDQVHLSIEPGVLGSQSIYGIQRRHSLVIVGRPEKHSSTKCPLISSFQTKQLNKFNTSHWSFPNELIQTTKKTIQYLSKPSAHRVYKRNYLLRNMWQAQLKSEPNFGGGNNGGYGAQVVAAKIASQCIGTGHFTPRHVGESGWPRLSPDTY